MFNIYFAGDLFDHKHITGNRLLADLIRRKSNGIYNCLLPQDWEADKKYTAVEIRNKDIAAVIQADLLIVNFDGTDLDSGTVVEFIIAKMLDIPVILLRTDLRGGCYLYDDDWNLMASGFPRSIIVKHNALKLYNQLGLEQMHSHLAQSIIDALDAVQEKPTLFKNYEEIITTYKHVITMCGSGLDQQCPNPALATLVASKIEKNIYEITSKED